MSLFTEDQPFWLFKFYWKEPISMQEIEGMFGTSHDAERVAVLIDGPSFYSGTRMLNWDVDFGALRRHLVKACDLRFVNYYNALSDDPEIESPVKPLMDWLGFNGFRTIIKTVYGEIKEYVSVAAEISTDIALLSMENKFDRIIVISNSGELSYALKKASEKGIAITVIGNSRKAVQDAGIENPSYSGIAGENLRKVADNFVELTKIRKLIEKARVDRGTGTGDAKVARFAPSPTARRMANT